MAGEAVPVAVHGVTVTGVLVALLDVLVGGVLVAVIKQWPKLKQIQSERISADDAATARLLEQQGGVIERQDKRIDQLANDLQAERDKREKSLEAERNLREHALAHERALCEAEMKIIRHALQNVRSNFYAMVDMLELDPSRTPEIIAKVKARRKEQEATEAAEKAQLVAAKITATAPAS